MKILDMNPDIDRRLQLVALILEVFEGIIGILLLPFRKTIDLGSFDITMKISFGLADKAKNKDVLLAECKAKLKKFLMPLCVVFGYNFTHYVNLKYDIFIIHHKSYCRKKARCIKCGRYICSGCNSKINGQYGYCMKCAGDNNIILPIKPLRMPKNIVRYEKSCNDRDPFAFLEED